MPALLVDPSEDQVQVYLAESILIYDGSQLQDAVTQDQQPPADDATAATAATAAEPTGDGACAPSDDMTVFGAESILDSDSGVAAAGIEDAYDQEIHGGAVGNTPVRMHAGLGSDGEGSSATDGGSDETSGTGTPLSHAAALSGAIPLADSLQLSGNATLPFPIHRIGRRFVSASVQTHPSYVISERNAERRHDIDTECDFESKICALHVDATFKAFQTQVEASLSSKSAATGNALSTQGQQGQLPHESEYEYE